MTLALLRGLFVGRELLPTGSRVYGTPREDSDEDYVVIATDDEVQKMKPYADSWHTEDGGSAGGSPAVFATLRFGRINLICVETADQFRVWRTGTEFLAGVASAKGPVTREFAVETFQRLEREML